MVDDSGALEEGFTSFIVELDWGVYGRIRFNVWETMRRSGLNPLYQAPLR